VQRPQDLRITRPFLADFPEDLLIRTLFGDD